MKKHYLTIIFLMLFYSSFAQDPQLFENDWYLQKAIIDGQDYFPPYSNFLGRLYLNTEYIEVVHPSCEEGFQNTIDYFPDSIFNIGDGGVVLIGTCGQPDIVEFMSKHYSIYYLENVIAKNPFLYTFTTDNGIIILTVVNSNGDEAIYGNELLSNQDFANSSFSIYPNPVQNILTIDNKTNTKITSTKLYDVLGRLVLVKKGNVKQLDASSLNSGLLFVKIETDEGVFTKKIIKE